MMFNTKEYLSQFVGEPIWIRVQLTITRLYYYIKVLDISGDKITLNYTEDYFVDDYEYHLEDHKPTLCLYNQRPLTMPLSTVVLLQPIILITEEELTDILEANDIEFNRGYNAFGSDAEDNVEYDYLRECVERTF